jgi:hypothetical protein
MAEKKKPYQRFQELARQATTSSNPARSDGNGETFLVEEAITICLSTELRRAVEQQAVADRTTPTEIIEEALRRYLELPR